MFNQLLPQRVDNPSWQPLVRISIAAKLLELFCQRCVIVVEEENQCEH